MTTANAAAWAERLRFELQFERLLPNLAAGLVVGVIEVVIAISLGNLVFSGPLAPYAPIGMGVALFTAALVMMMLTLTSPVAGLLGSIQDSPAVILSGITASLAGTLAARGVDPLATVLVAIALAPILTGGLFLALGSLKLAGLVRFIPFPVVGGFMAGTGWLLMRGSFGVMLGESPTLATLPALFQQEQLIRWLPGVIFALALFIAVRRVRHYVTMPAVVVGGMAVFYLALLVTNTPIGQAQSLGLLPAPQTQAMIWQPLSLARLSAADWGAIAGQIPNLAIILMIGLATFLLNASSLELNLQTDLDLNVLMRRAGWANLLSGVGGGMVGFNSLTLTMLSHRIGARGKLAGLIAGMLCLLLLVAGSSLLAYFPLPILGGLLFFLGLGFLDDWVVEGWKKLPRPDYAVVILILVVIAVTNFLAGVGIGLVVAIALFVVNYSRIDVVHHALSGAERTSSVERPPHHRRALSELGQQLYVLELQGFIFFGTANSLLERIKARLADPDQPPVNYLVLDFRRVSGLDSSAVLSFTRAKQVVEGRAVRLALAQVASDIRRRLEKGGLAEGSGTIRYFPDLDHSVEWCEDELLHQDRVTKVTAPATLAAQLKFGGFEADKVTRLMGYLERMNVDDGTHLIRQGEASDDLYFVEIGQVSIYLETADGQRIRLGVRQMGTLVGELGLYFGAARTASVITDGRCVVYRLSKEALAKMKADDPEVAAAFHEYIVRQLAERLMSTNRLVEALFK